MKLKIIFFVVLGITSVFCEEPKRHDLSLKGTLSIVGNGQIFWASEPFVATNQNGEKVLSSLPFRKSEKGWSFLVDGKIVHFKGPVVLAKQFD